MDLLKAKSIHIFAFPFFINNRKDEKEFKEHIVKSGWEEKSLDWRKCENDKELLMDYYMLEQYLSNSAENIFINEQTKACRVYSNPIFNKDEFKYVIGKGDKHYELVINEIELHVYDYGVGILFFKLLNMKQDLSIDDIKLINNFGRRVSMPFLPSDKDGYTISADSLGIVSDRCNLVMNYREKSNSLFLETAPDRIEFRADNTIISELLHPAKFIENVLNGNIYNDKSNVISIVTATDIPKKNTIPVMTMTDDRMFVMSLIRDKLLSEEIKNKILREKTKYKEKLYSVIFMDDNEPSCQHKKMRSELLEGASYHRWEDEGTLHAATGYSFVCITDTDAKIDYSVVRPFYLEYIYFVSLVLAQRLSIIKFSFDTEVLAKEMIYKRSAQKFIPRGIGKKLVNLQERYVSFINRMLILECSCQEQGIELYHLLQKQMLVDKEKNILDEQLHSMYEAVNTSNGAKIGWWGLVWACASAILAIVSLILAIVSLLP